MSQHRKRSRWGDGPRGAAAPPRVESSSQQISSSGANVSDEAALSALLSSAEARQKERQQQPEQQKRPRRDDRRGNDQRRNDSRRNDNRRNDDANARNNYYGPSQVESGKPETDNPNNGDDNDEDSPAEKQKPNFALSGVLAKDEDRGNVYKGVVLKFSEPPEARAPNTQWRLYVFKGEENVETMHVSRQSAYLLGRNEEIADIPLRHGSSSSQHAVLQYRALPNREGRLHCQPYLMDLESTNGSFINGVKIEPARYYQLKKGDVLKFGASSREYVLLTANTTNIEK